MTADDCRRAPEILAELSSGRWSDAAPAELRAHVETCPLCAELARVAGTLLADRRANEPAFAPPPSGAVWWRMQMRRRRDAAAAAARTVQRAQAAVVLMTVAGLATAFALSPLPGVAIAWLAAALPDPAFFRDVAGALPPAALALAIAAALFILTPVAIYLALAEE